MSNVINNMVRPASTVVLSLTSVTPTGVYILTSPDARTTFTLRTASVGVPTTFTVAATVLSQGADISGPVSVVEYLWDFGDGTTGYGSTVTHTYNVASPSAQMVVRATDNQGRHWYLTQPIYLGINPSLGATVGLSGSLTFVKSGP